MKNKLDIEKFKGIVNDLTLEYPELVYEEVEHEILGKACLYTRGENTPGCIIGQALVLYDPELEDTLVTIDNDPEDDPAAGELVTRLYGDLPEEFIDWISKVQSAQDNGVPWGLIIPKIKDL